jgi:hypothetical protein
MFEIQVGGGDERSRQYVGGAAGRFSASLMYVQTLSAGTYNFKIIGSRDSDMTAVTAYQNITIVPIQLT